MITCRSVSASSEWYQHVLGLESAHGGDEYEMLTWQRSPVLQLHDTDADEHPHLVRAGESFGNGVALYLETDDFDAAAARIHGASAHAIVDVLEDVHVNPLANHRELWLRDPDGYVIVVASTYGDVG